MRKSPVLLTVALVVAIIAGLYSCSKKVNGVNNDQVVETPFSLYFSDTAGGLFSSNDGMVSRQTLFKADGYPAKAICVSGNNILWAKGNLYISQNNGVNFNHTFDSSGTYPGAGCTGFDVDLNQSMMINIPSWNRVYTISTEDWTGNYLGVRYSLQQGVQGSWYTEGRPDTNGNSGGYGVNGVDSSLNITMSSYTYLTTGVLCMYDARHNRNFYKSGSEELVKETTSNPDADTVFYPLIGSQNHFHDGLRLPHHDPLVNPIDTSARYSYGHYNQRLIAIDNYNCNNAGAYYSDDTGRNWKPYSGLPNNIPLLCTSSPFEQICLIGTGGAGLYKLNTNTQTWEKNNGGLPANLIVRSIAFKENIYKNGASKKFVFLATNKGIYTSVDLGINWTMTFPGNYVAIY